MAHSTTESSPSSSSTNWLRSLRTLRTLATAILTASVLTGCGAMWSNGTGSTGPNAPWQPTPAPEPVGDFSALPALEPTRASGLSPQSAVEDALDDALSAVVALVELRDDSGLELDTFGENLNTDAYTEAWLRVDEAAIFGRIAATPSPEPVPVSVETQTRAMAGTVPPGELHMYVPGNGERYRVRVFDTEGRMRPEAVREISWALRARRGDRARTIEPRLITMLYMVGQHYDAELQIISGYRIRGAGASRGSRHGSAHACDFDIRGEGTRSLARYLDATFARAGVGYYPNSGFAHLDVRDPSYYWIDRSGSGQRSRTRSRTPSSRAAPADDPTLRSIHITEAQLYVIPPQSDD